MRGEDGKSPCVQHVPSCRDASHRAMVAAFSWTAGISHHLSLYYVLICLYKALAYTD